LGLVFLPHAGTITDTVTDQLGHIFLVSFFLLFLVSSKYSRSLYLLHSSDEPQSL